MHQGHYISSALLLFFASIMAGFVAPPVVAFDLPRANSKDEAQAECKQRLSRKNLNNDHETVYKAYVLYPDQQGNDVFYNCGYERVEETGINRSKKDCKSASVTYKNTPVKDVRYKCKSNGRWVLMDCSARCEPLQDEYYEKPNPVMEVLRKMLLKMAE